MRKSKRQNNPPSLFSANIKTIIKACRANKLRLYNLAGELCVSNRQIRFWKTGRSLPNVSSAIRIAQYFNLTLDELFFSEISPDRISGWLNKRK
jgi:transcriptional regulator with XRE-family HTH domain